MYTHTSLSLLLQRKTLPCLIIVIIIIFLSTTHSHLRSIHSFFLSLSFVGTISFTTTRLFVHYTTNRRVHVSMHTVRVEQQQQQSCIARQSGWHNDAMANIIRKYFSHPKSSIVLLLSDWFTVHSYQIQSSHAILFLLYHFSIQFKILISSFRSKITSHIYTHRHQYLHRYLTLTYLLSFLLFFEKEVGSNCFTKQCKNENRL